MSQLPYTTLEQRVERLMRDVSRLSAEIAGPAPRHDAVYALNRAWCALEKARMSLSLEVKTEKGIAFRVQVATRSDRRFLGYYRGCSMLLQRQDPSYPWEIQVLGRNKKVLTDAVWPGSAHKRIEEAVLQAIAFVNIHYGTTGKKRRARG